MTDAQAEALANLADALKQATDTALFDYLAGFFHPDIINTFCDHVEQIVKTELPKHY